MDSRERELERAAIGGDRDAQTELRELWKRTGRDLLPVHVRRRTPVLAALAWWLSHWETQLLEAFDRPTYSWSERSVARYFGMVGGPNWGLIDPIEDP